MMKRPLKRPRLGPPDVYPQEPKQKEDELTSQNLKHGITTMSLISEEFGTARNCNVTASKVGAYFNAILQRKEELMTLSDNARKKQTINTKDNFWPVTARTKTLLDTWFKDLAGTKPLNSLAKKAPSFNKKEEIFVMLSENQVSMQRATWFIKLSSAYTVAVSEAKTKKRQMPDPAAEWTATLTKFLKDLLPKLQEYYHHGPLPDKSLTSMLSSSSATGSACVAGSGSSTAQTASASASTIGGVSGLSTVPPPLTSPAAMHSPANANSNSNLLPPPQSVTSQQDEYQLALKQWTYCTQLSKYMYEEGLLDKQEFLTWILDLLEKIRSQPNEDGILKLYLPLTLQYMIDFVKTEKLARRLASMVCKKLGSLLNMAIDNGQITIANPPENQEELGKEDVQRTNPEICFTELLSCPHHRDVVLQLSAIIQVITIECSTALVWCGPGESRQWSQLNGSPLDHLPIAPSALPMPQNYRQRNKELRQQLRSVEEQIRARSKHAETRWCGKWQSLANASNNNRILSTLDALDSHCFDKMDTNNSLETLFAKVFQALAPSMANEAREKFEYNAMQDAHVIKILCEWAVSWQRWGEHRAMAVAWLLDKRQNEVLQAQENDSNDKNTMNDDKDSVCSGQGIGINGQPVLQRVLLDFLDNDAPVLEENGSAQNRTQFKNLVHLFSELIRRDVFSHDSYMCTLIARGDLTTKSIATHGQLTSHSSTASSLIPTGPISNTKISSPNNPLNVPSLDDDLMMAAMDFKPKMEEFDDSNVDEDLDKILQHINTDQNNSMDAPDSPKEPDSSSNAGGHSGHGGGGGHNHGQTTTTSGPCSSNLASGDSPPVSRHFLYTQHFPLPQESVGGGGGDPGTQHDSNQRYILLFGVGKERDEKKHAVKKMSKEICKLFSKKFSVDVADNGRVKKHSRSEFNFEATTNKCQSMSYFDQHYVTWQCAVTVQEMLNSFALGNSNYLPVQEHVAFLFDLMEMALNIYGLIDICIQMLRELLDVESQLVAKNSVLVKSYTTSLSLYIVGVLRRYHCCLLLSPAQTTAVFEGLCKVVKHVTNPSDCSSAERCILAYLYDVYLSCALLKKTQSTEPFHNAHPKIKQAYNAPIQVLLEKQVYNEQFMVELLANPKRGGSRLEQGRQLLDSPSNRYSFVVNAILAVIREQDNDRLNDIATTCAELTACCNALSAEWLAALMALCGAKTETYYPDSVLAEVDVSNLNIHNSLAVFTCILVARHCFSLTNFTIIVALRSLVASFDNGKEVIEEGAEAGARLTCHLLLRLFKTVEMPQPGLYSVSTSPNPIVSGPACNIKLSCDRHLLAAAHNNISVEPVLAVLKAILGVADSNSIKGSSYVQSTTAGNGGKRSSGLNTPVHPGSGTPKSVPVELSHILGTSDLGILGGGDEPMLDLCQQSNETTSNLSEFAQHVLRQLCSQEWVLERCLQNSEKLCSAGMLIDDTLNPKQAQKLLHMICYSEPESNFKVDLDQKAFVVRILENLEQWSIRISWLELQLMYKQTEKLSDWLETVASAAIDVFQLSQNNAFKEKSSIWLVSPLVSKLPSPVQGRILKVAGQRLENTNFFNMRAKEEINDCGGSGGSNSNSPSAATMQLTKMKPQCQLRHQPFLSLVLTCLKGQDEQKDDLLKSLLGQLSQFLQMGKELEKVGGIEDPRGREKMLDALQLRFALIGGMFDSIQKNATSTTDWPVLLAQLISQGVIDLTNNSELFTTVLDMLATLIHSAQNSDTQSSDRDENKKHYMNLMKKLRKELGDKHNTSIGYVRQLLPLAKQQLEVIACDSSSNPTDNKGNKISGFDAIDKKHGLRLSDKHRVGVWELLEGYKNPTPLSWLWFGAVKMERKPLAYEETHRLLRFHTHSLVKPSSYYYEPLPLPPEDLEPLILDKQPKDELMKADTPSSVDQSPSAMSVGGGGGGGGGGNNGGGGGGSGNGGAGAGGTGGGPSNNGGRGRGKSVRKPRKPKSVNNNNSVPTNSVVNIGPNPGPPQQPMQGIVGIQQQQQQQQQQQMLQQQQQQQQQQLPGNNMQQQPTPMQQMQVGGGVPGGPVLGHQMNPNQMQGGSMQNQMQQQPGNQMASGVGPMSGGGGGGVGNVMQMGGGGNQGMMNQMNPNQMQQQQQYNPNNAMMQQMMSQGGNMMNNPNQMQAGGVGGVGGMTPGMGPMGNSMQMAQQQQQQQQQPNPGQLGPQQQMWGSGAGGGGVVQGPGNVGGYGNNNNNPNMQQQIMFNQQQQQQQQQQPGAGMMGPQMNRFDPQGPQPPMNRPQSLNPSKQALSNMLRQRHPNVANVMSGGGGGGIAVGSNAGNVGPVGPPVGPPNAGIIPFNLQQQQRQQQQQQQQQQFIRNTGIRQQMPGQMSIMQGGGGGNVVGVGANTMGGGVGPGAGLGGGGVGGVGVSGGGPPVGNVIPPGMANQMGPNKSTAIGPISGGSGGPPMMNPQQQQAGGPQPMGVATSQAAVMMQQGGGSQNPANMVGSSGGGGGGVGGGGPINPMMAQSGSGMPQGGNALMGQGGVGMMAGGGGGGQQNMTPNMQQMQLGQGNQGMVANPMQQQQQQQQPGMVSGGMGQGNMFSNQQQPPQQQQQQQQQQQYQQQQNMGGGGMGQQGQGNVGGGGIGYPNVQMQAMNQQQQNPAMMNQFGGQQQRQPVQSDYLAQQRAMQANRQQQQQQQQGQYMQQQQQQQQQVPNVTMNNMVPNQGAAPPYRQNVGGGKPQQFQQMSQQQRIRQQMLMQQQVQGEVLSDGQGPTHDFNLDKE